jgi:hypothetical protein
MMRAGQEMHYSQNLNLQEYVVYRSYRHIKVAGSNDFNSPHIKQHSHTSPQKGKITKKTESAKFLKKKIHKSKTLLKNKPQPQQAEESRERNMRPTTTKKQRKKTKRMKRFK